MPEPSDLGLSGRIANSPQKRIMRPDGSFDVVRLGHGFWPSLNVYQHVLTVSWPRFFAYVFALSQFVMTWTLCALYVRAARRWDVMNAELLARLVRR